MKKFENPAIEVIAIAVEDVIATSVEFDPDCPNKLPDEEM